MKRLFLILTLAICMLAGAVQAQTYDKAALLVGAYCDFDAKESADANWSTFLGASVPLKGRFYGLIGGEFGNNDVGDEYALSFPAVLAYAAENDFNVTGNIYGNVFFLLGGNLTWTDIQQSETDFEMVNYYLMATGIGGTLSYKDIKLWAAYQTAENRDYSISRIGFGVRWALF